MDLRIWWTSESDQLKIGGIPPVEFPPYLAAEYRSRVGRNGRGSLWVAPQFGEVECAMSDEAIKRSIERRSAGGIVLKAEDLHCLPSGIGFVTDLGGGLPGLTFRFDKALEADAIQMFWIQIIGEFELSDRGGFFVQSADDFTITVDHPDPEKLLQLGESFYERRWESWPAERSEQAMYIYAKLFKNLLLHLPG